MHRTKELVSYSLKVRELMGERRQFPPDSHAVPETQEEGERATRLTNKLRQLAQDEDFAPVRNIYIYMIDTLLNTGTITDEQYLSIHEYS